MGDVVTALLAEVLPVLLELAGLVLAAVLARAAVWAQRRFGIEIEARHREALHRAILTGLEAAIAAGAPGDLARDAAVSHARASVPDAIRALKPGEGVLASIAAAKLRALRGGADAS